MTLVDLYFHQFFPLIFCFFKILLMIKIIQVKKGNWHGVVAKPEIIATSLAGSATLEIQVVLAKSKC